MSFADAAVLWTDPTFQGRVRAALVVACNNTATETLTGDTGTIPLQLHIFRARLAGQIINNINNTTAGWTQTFAICVATDTTVLNDATVNGTVEPLTTGNVAAQAALVTDTHISNAIAAQFNTFLTLA